MYEQCLYCQRKVLEIDMTIHHIVPQSLGGKLEDTVHMCKTCHEYLHYCIPIEEVTSYQTLEKLQEHECFGKYLKWIKTIKHEKKIKVKKIIKQINQLSCL